MEGLIKAVSDVLAAILGALGFVGRPRRRAAIRHDLELLRDLERSPEFDTGTVPHSQLVDHIAREVAKHAGAVVPRRKKVQWYSVIISALIGLALAYWTFSLDRDGFRWLSLLPGTIGALFLVVAIGMVVDPDSTGRSSDGEANTA